MKNIAFHKITRYIMFILSILFVISLDLLLLKFNCFFYFKYSNIEFIIGVTSGILIYFLNILILRLGKSSKTRKKTTPSKSSIKTLLKLFPGKAGFILMIIHMGAVVFFEELIYRNYMLGFLVLKIGIYPLGALLMTSLIYAILHFNLKNLIPLTIMGILFGILTLSTGNLLSAVTAHFTNNLIIALKYKLIKNEKLIIN